MVKLVPPASCTSDAELPVSLLSLLDVPFVPSRSRSIMVGGCDGGGSGSIGGTYAGTSSGGGSGGGGGGAGAAPLGTRAPPSSSGMPNVTALRVGSEGGPWRVGAAAVLALPSPLPAFRMERTLLCAAVLSTTTAAGVL